MTTLLRLYSDEIGFHTPYLAMLAKDAAEGFGGSPWEVRPSSSFQEREA